MARGRIAKADQTKKGRGRGRAARGKSPEEEEEEEEKYIVEKVVDKRLVYAL